MLFNTHIVRSAPLVMITFLALLFASSSQAAKGAFKFDSGKYGGGYVVEATCFSIKAIDSIKVKRIDTWFYTSTKGTTTGSIDIWYKPGNIATATANTSGWTKAGTYTGSFRHYTQGITQIALDLDIVVKRGEEMTIVLAGDNNMSGRTIGDGTPAPDASNAHAELTFKGRQGNHNGANPPSFSSTATRGFQGEISFDLAGVEWSGSESSDWNDEDNWDAGEVPLPGDDILIPATTVIPPVLPNGLELGSLTIEDGAELHFADGSVVKVDDSLVLEGSAEIKGALGARLEIGGDAEFSPTATIDSQGLTLVFNGTSDQELITGGLNVGNIAVDNSGNMLRVRDEWKSINSGLITLEPNANMSFVFEDVGFDLNSFDNRGLIHFGLDGGGTVATKHTISTGGQNIGNVEIFTADAMDSVSFPNSVIFGDIRIHGVGPVEFLGMFGSTGLYSHELEAPLSLNNISGSADIEVASLGAFTVNGPVEATSLHHKSGSAVTLNGSLTLSGDLTLESLLNNPSFTVAGQSQMRALNVKSTDPATFGSVTAESLTFSADGEIQVNGNMIVEDYSASADGVLNQTGFTSDIERLSLGGTHRLTLTSSLSIGDISMSGDSRFEVAGGLNMVLEENLLLAAQAEIFVSGTTFLFADQRQDFVAGGLGFTSGSLQISNSVGAFLSGEIHLRSGGLAPAFMVNTGSGVELAGGTELFFDSTQEQRVRVLGSLVAFNTLFQAGSVMNQHGWMEVAGNISLRNSTFENFGSPTQDYALDMLPGSSLDAMVDVSFRGVDAAKGAILLQSDNLPSQFRRLHLSGTSPESINANAISGIRVDISKNSTDAGNLYSSDREEDDNHVLYWENDSVLDISNGGTLPNALVDGFYSHTMSAIGGNEPLEWTLANHPGFLSINPQNGTITGTPGRDDVGIYNFLVFVSDSSRNSQVDSQLVSLTVDGLEAVQITITNASFPNGRVGSPYGFALTAIGGRGGPYTFDIISGELPSGIALGQDGLVTGIPSDNSEGVYQVTLQVSDQDGNGSVKVLEMRIQNNLLGDDQVPSDLLNDGPGGGGCSMASVESSLLLLLLLVMLMILSVARGSTYRRP